jgi:excisionase family DNA binding protein
MPLAGQSRDTRRVCGDSYTHIASTTDTKRMESMDQSGSDRDLMTVADAAQSLSRSTEQVRRYLREGRLVGRRMGGQWFIERAAVESFGKVVTKEDQFTRKLRPASRVRPLDDVIGIGEGPGSDISTGKHQYRMSSLRRR